jgi:TolB-like protein/Tfp pilus assembly protein PilF
VEDFIERLKQRKLVQWALAYAAAAFALIQVLDIVAQRFGWSESMERFTIVAMAFGFFVTLVLAWYHGERGAQKTTSTELLILALLLTIGGVVAWRLAPAPATTKADVASSSPGVGSLAATAIPGKSIAVLPFVNMSGDPKNDYFSDGITEEILNALAQLPDLKVAARTSAFAFKGKNEDLRKVGQELDVSSVLEGSVQTVGDEVRITVQLIDTVSGYHRWSEKYDRKLTSIFAVEDEISKAIAERLQVQFAGSDQRPLVARRSVDSRAHEFYLRGLPLIAARGPGLREAAANFQQAVAIDPDYAQAWAALAETQMLLPHYFLEPRDTAFPAGEAAARRALAIDPNTASAYVALAMMYRIQWKWLDADAAFQHALQIAPGDAEAIDQYGQFLLAEGRLDEALAQIDRAQRLDPLSGIIAATRINVLTGVHRFEDADKQARSMLAQHPDYALGHYIAADVAIYRHDYPRAKSQFQEGARLVGENPDVYMLLVDGIAVPAQRSAATHAVLDASADARQRLTAPARIKWLMLLGDHDDALDALQRIGHDVMFGQDNVWQPAFDPVRGDPRFKAALLRMGFPSAPLASNRP